MIQKTMPQIRMAVLFALLYTSRGIASDAKEESRVEWNTFLTRNCTEGLSEEAVRQLMAGKFREFGFARSNDEVHRLLYLVDDFHQVEFAFDRSSKLLFIPAVETKGQWLRLPTGEISLIPDPLELKLRSQAEDSAIQYVVQHKGRDRNTLSAVGRRSRMEKEWDVVVFINSLEVDAPTYVLKVSATGQVRDLRRPVQK